MDHLVIMAGGVGSRFWPMSTPEKPKQFIDVLATGHTLLQLTVGRFDGICSMKNTWVVTAKRYYQLVKDQLPGIPDENILLEPCMRNTAPCIAYVAWKIKMKDPEANLVISPSDHVVTDTMTFREAVKKGLAFIAQGNRILTLGICPTRPETGYGYIKVRPEKETEDKIRTVEGFKEKPDLKTAYRYLEEGGYYWNAGIFFWSVRTIEKAFRQYQKNMAALFDELSAKFYTSYEQTVIDENYHKATCISIDYAIMEQAANIFVLPGDFGWSDLGTWGSLYEQLPKDSRQNAVVGAEVRMIESRGCIVHVPEERQIVVQGLEDYIIVEENGVILICRKAEEQRIKEFMIQM